MFIKMTIFSTFQSNVIKAFLSVVALISLAALPALAQTSGTSPAPRKPTQEAPAEAGGPQGDIGPMAIPKKKETPPEPPPKPPKNPEGMGDFSITKNVNLVTLEATVLTKNGQFVPGLKKENFRVLEDGKPQTITNFQQTSEAPITAVLLVEFARTNYYFVYDAMNAAYTFANSLKPQDWIATVSFDLKPRMLTDFTQDKRTVFESLRQLQIPGFSETCVFDALYDTLDRLEGVSGRKYVILIGSGYDSFSKHTFDQIQKKVKSTQNVTIYTISTGEYARIMSESSMGGPTRLTFLQADNQMNTWARETGGRWYKPRFEGELPGIFQDIAASIRNQYILAYHPSNDKLDGSYRKLKIELQAPDGGKLTVKDQKGKDLPVQVVARDGYTSKHQVE